MRLLTVIALASCIGFLEGCCRPWLTSAADPPSLSPQQYGQGPYSDSYHSRNRTHINQPPTQTHTRQGHHPANIKQLRELVGINKVLRQILWGQCRGRISPTNTRRRLLQIRGCRAPLDGVCKRITRHSMTHDCHTKNSESERTLNY